MGQNLLKWENLPEIARKLQKAGKQRKRKRFTKFSPKKFVFLGKRVTLKQKWAPTTKLGVEAFEIIKTGREIFNKLSNAEQALLVAFLANRFPGGGKTCKKCDSGERVT